MHEICDQKNKVSAGEGLLHMLPIGVSNRFSSRDAKPNSMISDCTASRAACNYKFDFATLLWLQTCTMHANPVHALMQPLNQSLCFAGQEQQVWLSHQKTDFVMLP